MPRSIGIGENTTIGVVATNAELGQKEAAKVAEMARDGPALVIRPVHTLRDGNMIFAVAPGELELPPPISLSLAPDPSCFKEEGSSLAHIWIVCVS